MSYALPADNPDILENFDAWLFDLDGVITDTAKLHAVAWKAAFDDYLKSRDGEDFQEFSIEGDYHTYVDGKPRYEGVDSFLRSRNIELEWGDPTDGPENETVCGIGNRKNIAFNETLEKDGVFVFERSVDLINELKARGKKIAVVTSSKNCNTVLKAANLEGVFEAQVDGIYAAENKIAGKPKPDTFLEAARMLDTPAERAVVIEDAISGVQAGRAGGFGLTLGVDRHGEAAQLKENGADLVVSDLGELLD